LKYNSHFNNIKSHFPGLDLLKETEFNLFRNEIFAVSLIETCVSLCSKSSENLNINLNFGVIYNHTYNASARIKGNQAIITFNLGLIDKLDIIISDSVNLFMSEDIANATTNKIQKEELKQICCECCISYLFYHELAHIIQISGTKENNSYDFQEKYTEVKLFDVKQHVYEFDADLFGAMLSVVELMKNIMNENYQFKSVVLFNSLTALIFALSNIIIEYSRDLFDEIYYQHNSHPHPFIRIIKCNEQILGNILKNLDVSKEFLDTIFQRSTTMISQVLYSKGRTLNYAKFYNNNSKEIKEYIDEIEDLNILHKELTRYKTEDFFNKLIN
jgi:hypothetical protein